MSARYLFAILLFSLGCSVPVPRAPRQELTGREDYSTVIVELRKLQAHVTRLESQIANTGSQPDIAALKRSVESLERSVASLRTELERQSEILTQVSKTLTTPRPPPAAEPRQTTDVTVYVTRTGKKYHRAGCQYLRLSSAVRRCPKKGTVATTTLTASRCGSPEVE